MSGRRERGFGLSLILCSTVKPKSVRRFASGNGRTIDLHKGSTWRLFDVSADLRTLTQDAVGSKE